MGQEVVYCFKCQKRIQGNDFAKGQAYQVENNFCCSACAVGVLETLPPKAKEQLLAKMFKATQDRQSGSSPALKALGPPPSARIAGSTPRPMRSPVPQSSGMLIGVIVAALVVVVLVAVFLSSGSPPPVQPPPVVGPKPIPVKPPDPGPSNEEKRRAESAKEAMRKAREFAQANPKDLEGQARQWRAALPEAAQTGYELEIRRETEKAEVRAKEAAAQELADLGREVRALSLKQDFKAASDLLDRSQTRRTSVEWASGVDALRREVQEEMARRAAAASAWRPLFDGKSLDLIVSLAATTWMVVDGALTRDLTKPDQAAQSREDYGDGEIRFRFITDNSDHVFFAVRQGAGGQVRIALDRPKLQSLTAGPHEVIFVCRATEVCATLDGNPIPVLVEGKVIPRGRLQFNFSSGTFRLQAVEMRDLR